MAIFGNFFGDKTLDGIEGSIDNIISTIRSANSDNQQTEDKNMEQSLMQFMSQNDDINKILESVTIPPDRTMRYRTYEEIVRTAPFMKRVLRVYLPYILQKNPVTNQCYLIRNVNELDEDAIQEDQEKIDKAETQLKKFIKKYDFVTKLKSYIIPHTVLFGDCFVEILDKKDEGQKVDLNKLITLNEAKIPRLTEQVNSKNNGLDAIIESFADSLVYIDSVGTKKEEQKPDTSPRTLDDLMLRVHKPHKIMILETNYGTRLGYLEVFQDEMSKTHNIGQSLTNLVGRLTQNAALNASLKPDDIVNKLILGILKKIMSNAPAGNNKDVNSVVQDLNPDIYAFIKQLVIEQGSNNKIDKLNMLKVRFIRTDRMQQFSLPLTTDYLPYGTSLIDPIILPCKLYILSQLGNIITKLSRAPAIRKWTIEQGTSQMSGQLIQRLKRELHNSRITAEDLSSWKTIPKILSDYKDLYLLSRQGNKSLDVEVTSLGDPSIKVQDLQDARSEIIALSGIPAPSIFNGRPRSVMIFE